MLTSGRNTPERADVKYVVLGVCANTEIFEGGLVAIDEDGYATPALKEAGLRIVGRAERYVHNITNTDGYENVTVNRGCFKYDNSETSPVTAAHLFTPCYIENDETVSSDGTGSYPAGIVVEVEADGVWVDTAAYIPVISEAAETNTDE